VLEVRVFLRAKDPSETFEHHNNNDDDHYFLVS